LGEHLNPRVQDQEQTTFFFDFMFIWSVEASSKPSQKIGDLQNSQTLSIFCQGKRMMKVFDLQEIAPQKECPISESSSFAKAAFLQLPCELIGTLW
jgi:hypothetical protein